MKSKKLIVISIVIILTLIVWITTALLKKNSTTISQIPNIVLEGADLITIDVGMQFQEPGFHVTDKNGKDLTQEVKVDGKVDTSKPGLYELIYSITNRNGMKSSVKRRIKVESPKQPEYKEEYDALDNKTIGWGLLNKKDGTRPDIDIANLRKLGAYAMGPDEKILYLTFDEGSMDTYLKEIVDILNQNDVKGTFFLCKNYIKNNPDLIKSMVQKGHSIGNHTANHPSMPTLATKENYTKYLKEIEDTEKTFEEITGTKFDPVYREPKGEYSERSLTMIKDLGYRTYFWSAAYKDWDDSISKEEALKFMLERVHNGAIYLLHPRSKGNYLALDDFIKQMKKEGYKFDLVKNIP